MRMPLFNLFDMADRQSLFETMNALGPRRAWQIIGELAQVDEPLFAAGLPAGSDYPSISARAAGFMRLAPRVPPSEVDSLAQRFASYGYRLQVECAFMSFFWADAATIFGDVVEVVGQEHLRAALQPGHGVLALPLHVGPSYAAPAIMAHHVLTTAVYNHLNFDPLRQATCPQLPIEGFGLETGDTLRRGIAAMRDGRAFAIYPELDPRGVDHHHERVSFLGTTVVAPVGPVIMSRMSKAPMLPVILTATGDGTFRLAYHEPLPAPAVRDDVHGSLVELWAVIEREVMAAGIADWEMWLEFDRMLPESVAGHV